MTPELKIWLHFMS